MRIGYNTLVRINFSVFLPSGEKFYSSNDEASLEFKYGRGEILPKLEKELTGLCKGDEKEVILPPHEGYGPFDPDKLKPLPKEIFSENTELKIGHFFECQVEDGRIVPFYIRGILADKVIADFNHPLAGKTVKFHVKVLDVQRIN